jgi:hypothetical protein
MVNNYTPATQGAEMADSVKLEGQLVEMKFNSIDKIKVARVIATALGLDNTENISKPEQLINSALRKIGNKTMKPEYIEVLHKMLKTAREAEINFDENLVPVKVNEELHLDEAAHKIGAPVEIISGSGKGIKGHIGEIRHGLFKGAPKTYTVYHGGNGAIAVKKHHIRALKEDVVDEVRLSAAAKLQLAFQRQQEKSTASRKRAQELLNPPKKEEPKKLVAEVADILEAMATAKLLGKDTTELQAKLSQARSMSARQDSDDFAEISDVIHPETNVGHTLVHSDQGDHVRKMKIHYTIESTVAISKATKAVVKATIGAKQAKERAELTKKHESEKDRISEALGTEDIPDEDKEKTVGLTTVAEDNDEDTKDFNLDFSEKDIEDIVNSVNTEDDIIESYEDSELAIIDEDTAEHIDNIEKETINEVLSRAERIKAKARFAKTAAKRERKTKIALKTRSSSSTINARARRLAIELMKKRIAKKPLSQLSISEKERLEKIIAGRKTLLNRLAMKLVPKVRSIENNRLTHKNYTK